MDAKEQAAGLVEQEKQYVDTLHRIELDMSRI
jgi:hypothetical protein